ncbi:hypothetical protein [uncultured Mitsuokella sp.]|uniref:hypothetical protein n=1 Tax=uncultured Mitsuokella sp. TaxID=453120 RepID=UPI002616388F|nr:hypothetical protein [uncultured Mitsuokella sp.]
MNQVGIKGHFTGILRHADGTEEKFEKDNLILDIGYEWIRQRLFAGTLDYGYVNIRANPMNCIAIGSGGTGETAEPKATEFGVQNLLTIKTAGVTFDAKDVHKVKLVAVFGQGEGTGTITEAGVCNNPASSVLLGKPALDPRENQQEFRLIYLDRVTFPENPVVKESDDTYTCVFRFEIGKLARTESSS